MTATAEPSFAEHATLSGHSRSVTSLRFSPDGRTLVSAGADGFVHTWDAETGAHQRSLRAHRTGINELDLSPDGLYLATASDDTSVRVFALDPVVSDRAEPLRTLTGHTAPVLCCAWGPRGNLIATGSFDESAIVWDVRRGTALRSFPAHAEAIWTIGWDSEGSLVLTGSADGLIRLWDITTAQCLRTLDNETNSPVGSARFTPSSFFILAAALSSTIRIYSLYNSKVLKTFRDADYVSERYPSPALVFAAHTKETPARDEERPACVIAGSEKGCAVIWDLQDRRVLQTLRGHGTPVVAVAVDPSGRRVATGSIEPEATIKLWQL